MIRVAWRASWEPEVALFAVLSAATVSERAQFPRTSIQEVGVKRRRRDFYFRFGRGEETKGYVLRCRSALARCQSDQDLRPLAMLASSPNKSTRAVTWLVSAQFVAFFPP